MKRRKKEKCKRKERKEKEQRIKNKLSWNKKQR
jgi:hypothetical protein